MRIDANVWTPNPEVWEEDALGSHEFSVTHGSDCEPDCQWSGTGARYSDFRFIPLATSEARSDAEGSDDSGSKCLPGRGMFELSPLRLDGGRRGAARVVQVSGTGRFTADAWISDARVASGGTVLTHRHSGEVVKITSDVQILGEGQLDGRALYTPSGPGRSTLDLGWGCRKSAAPPRGDASYSFTLSDIGCAVDFPQRLTARPQYGRRPTLTVELYGQPEISRSVNLRPASGGPGRIFRYQGQGAVVRGTVIGADDDLLVVDLREASWHGLPMCVAGTYQIHADRQ